MSNVGDLSSAVTAAGGSPRLCDTIAQCGLGSIKAVKHSADNGSEFTTLVVGIAADRHLDALAFSDLSSLPRVYAACKDQAFDATAEPDASYTEGGLPRMVQRPASMAMSVSTSAPSRTLAALRRTPG